MRIVTKTMQQLRRHQQKKKVRRCRQFQSGGIQSFRRCMRWFWLFTLCLFVCRLFKVFTLFWNRPTMVEIPEP